MATIWALFLPSVGQSIYFYRTDASDENLSVEQGKKIAQPRTRASRWLCCCGDSNHNDVFDDQHESSLCNTRCLHLCSTCLCGAEDSARRKLLIRIKRAYALLWKHFVQAYTDHRVLKWSVWWALGTCGYLQVANYMQLLWEDTVKPTDKIYNGAVDFLYAIIGEKDIRIALFSLSL